MGIGIGIGIGIAQESDSDCACEPNTEPDTEPDSEPDSEPEPDTEPDTDRRRRIPPPMARGGRQGALRSRSMERSGDRTTTRDRPVAHAPNWVDISAARY